MPKPKIGGYHWRQNLQRAVNSNKAARAALRRMIDEEMISRQVLAILVARAANSLAENLEALRDLEVIVKNERPE